MSWSTDNRMNICKPETRRFGERENLLSAHLAMVFREFCGVTNSGDTILNLKEIQGHNTGIDIMGNCRRVALAKRTQLVSELKVPGIFFRR